MLLNGVHTFFFFQIGDFLFYQYYLPRFVIKCHSVLIEVLETKYNSIYIIIAFYSTEILYSSSNYKNIAYIL